MPVIAWIAARLVAAKVSQVWAGRLAWLIAIGAAVLIAWAGWSLLKGAIIGAHDNQVGYKRATEQLDRQGEADGQDITAAQRQDRDADQLEGAIDNAVDDHPKDARTGVGPGTAAALDELRRRQSRGVERR